MPRSTGAAKEARPLSGSSRNHAVPLDTKARSAKWSAFAARAVPTTARSYVSPTHRCSAALVGRSSSPCVTPTTTPMAERKMPAC